MLKVMTVFGTRPEAIKMAPLVKKLNQEERIESIVTVTAQHREMLDQVLDLFEIEPAYDLDIMESVQSLTDITVNVLQGLKEVISEEKPDIVLVHGDTSTTFVGALASFYQKLKVGHVEAGLRTHNKYSPYPEEINRQLTGVLADLHFAPTKTAKDNLLAENIDLEKVFITGNTVIDALLETVKEDYKFDIPKLNQIDFENKKVILLTSHRRENLGEPMENIFNGIKEIVENNQDVEVVFPVHLNPKVREIVNNILGDTEDVHLIEPLDYQPFANLMAKSYLVMTDSGGIQEEAPSLAKPVLVLRDNTERPEAVEAGTVELVGTDQEKIISIANKLINDDKEYQKMANAVNPYGDGKASDRIVDSLLYKFNCKKERPLDYIYNEK
ncbi:UDP-N-acetylglucosamine 2-epimerase (non-hydrolyzing) [Natroniella acetigena]|uniref:non-hydrolyzing UDP-N-acetylglucosamine 2-epimerase n=1 Tax=Natroniella acetigena TaxID=52004 RepID=UPI002009E65A|nr:UDP-N-acetylglucosamine 2-epimerase (non-hydrolyzing) [Natroniella acetigena]MCK8827693.1 UDP-N-acetylglucosamine 2-epimerase (non-hydrolyzing) [Natroniella acetigena]